jgi:hypothetical protein
MELFFFSYLPLAVPADLFLFWISVSEEINPGPSFLLPD